MNGRERIMMRTLQRRLQASADLVGKLLADNPEPEGEEGEEDNKKYKYEAWDMKAARGFDEILSQTQGTAHRPATERKLEKWANTFRLMRERDKIDPAQIGATVRWALEDNFWSAIILSPEKLRDKFEQLNAQAQRKIDSPL